MSMNTKDYKTKTMVVERDFPCRDNYWAVGLDIGYSAVKGISPAHYFCFPAYAKKIPENRPLLKEAADTDIRYRDNEGEWVVGNLAYEEMDASKMTESEEEVFGRKRYYSPMFKVIVRTGLGIALMEGKEKSSDGKKLYVQTGLPPKFMRDSEDLKEVFKGIHLFELKLGTAPWQTFTFSLDEQNISIMPQPLGALLSASTDITVISFLSPRNSGVPIFLFLIRALVLPIFTMFCMEMFRNVEQKHSANIRCVKFSLEPVIRLRTSITKNATSSNCRICWKAVRFALKTRKRWFSRIATSVKF